MTSAGTNQSVQDFSVKMLSYVRANTNTAVNFLILTHQLSIQIKHLFHQQLSKSTQFISTRQNYQCPNCSISHSCKTWVINIRLKWCKSVCQLPKNYQGVGLITPDLMAI